MFEKEKIQLNNITIYIIRYTSYCLEDYSSILLPCEKERMKEFKSEKRKREFLATRILKEQLFPGSLIEYSPEGAPYIENMPYISISHTSGCSAIAVCPSHHIGLDIEPIEKKAQKLHKKFLNETEQSVLNTSDDLIMTRAWSCKESLYKLSKRKGILFKRDLIIESYNSNTDVFYCSLLKDGAFFSIHLTSMLLDNIIITINHTDCIPKT